jgi:outer membrane protein OmpA-like peptidoglycan-associated protein
MANRSSTSLNLQSEDTSEAPRDRGLVVLLLLLLLIASVAGLGYLGYRILQRTESAERQLASLSGKSDEATALARQALEKAVAADAAARAAAEGRQVAEVQAAGARQEAEAARQEASTARQEANTAVANAAQAQAEADRIRKRAEAERDRLEAALGQIAETRRTALGLVMNLGGDHLKFEFDKAELSVKDRELLSRIAGILMTAQDYTISVNGHTDDVGSAAYNQGLSERRAQAVRDYLEQAGLPAEILSVTGHGKSLPLVWGTSDAARAKNRRVELAIANTQIRYGR